MSHTEGRLEMSDRYIVKGLQVIATCISAYGFVDSEANARRLVACWNALDGIPTEEIESGTAGFLHRYATVVDERDDLVKERDELVARHNGMIAALRSFSGGTGILDLAEIEAIIEEYPEAS